VNWIEAQLNATVAPIFPASNISFSQRYSAPERTAHRTGRRCGLGGGGRYRGARGHTGVNVDPMLQPDEKLRALNSQPTEPGEREEVYCTKIGATHPDEIVHRRRPYGRPRLGEAANDDGSGTALVMELARILSAPDVKTERSIRFALWNNEESGLNGARAVC